MSTPSDGIVVYEGWFRASAAAYARFGRALIENKVRLVDSYRLDAGATPVVLVKGTPENLKKFIHALKGGDFKYKSPTVFDNGTILPIYHSPEDELADKKNEWAAKLLSEQGR